MNNTKRLAIFGATGSIGLQTLDIVKAYPELFKAAILTANNDIEQLSKLAIKHKPEAVVIANTEKHEQLTDLLTQEDIAVYSGKEMLTGIIDIVDIDLVLNAIVGFAGLTTTIKSIENKKPIALANKESLVIAGELVNKLSREYDVPIYPVDSEHSAIYQCLIGEEPGTIEKIYLTASGGPFRGKSHDFLANVTKKEALAHPTWNMGNKITIDSASLMNKGLEAIEAKWLFDITPDQIEIIIHPQSIIHSIVQFIDGSMKAQMGVPDMRGPILFALGYPERIKSEFKRFNFSTYKNLTFEIPEPETFRNLKIAYKAMERGGNIPCAMNAANEIVVDAFLKEHIGFLQMSDIIEKTLSHVTYKKSNTLQDYINTDKEAREIALAQLAKINSKEI